MNLRVIKKIEKIFEENDDLINSATSTFNSYLNNNVNDSEAKNALHFLNNNNISPFGAKTTLANMASGIGKTMDNDEALSMYEKAENGKNTVPNSYALQSFFEKNRSSENESLDNLMHGLGKEPEVGEVASRYINPFAKKGIIDPDNQKMVDRWFSKNLNKGIEAADNGDTSGNIAQLYPSVFFGSAKTLSPEFLQKASDMRTDTFGEDNPKVIGKYLQDRLSDSPKVQQGFELINDIKIRMQDYPVTNDMPYREVLDFLKENDPELYKKVQDYKEYSSLFKRIDNIPNDISRHTKNIYKYIK